MRNFREAQILKNFNYVEVTDLEPEDFATISTTSKAQRVLREKFMEVSMKAQLGLIKSFYVPKFEPSFTDGHLSYVEDIQPYCSSELNHWKKLAEEYFPEKGSRLASVDEYFIILARLYKDRDFNVCEFISPLQIMADDSSIMGNYLSTYESSKRIENTGYRRMGLQLSGFVGNTYKLLLNPDNFYIGGGCFMNYGDEFPLGQVVQATKIPAGFRTFTVGLVVLED